MIMREEEVQFKKTLLGGYKREDVHVQYEMGVSEARRETQLLMEEFRTLQKGFTALSKEKEDVDAENYQLKTKLDDKEQDNRHCREQLEALQGQLQRTQGEVERYREDYLCISKQMVDAQKRANEIIEDAQQKKLQLVAATQKEIMEKRFQVERDIEERLGQSEAQYDQLQDKMQQVLSIFNGTQAKFMSTYKEIQRLIGTLPDHLSD